MDKSGVERLTAARQADGMHQVWGSSEHTTSNSHTSSRDRSNDSSGTEHFSAAAAASGHGAEHVVTRGQQGTSSGEASQGVLPSKGSWKHEFGNCRPCRYVNTKVGCRYGSNCNCCHMHVGATRIRPNPERRARVKSQVNSLKPDEKQELQELTGQGGYMETVAQGRMRKVKEKQDVEEDEDTQGLQELASNSGPIDTVANGRMRTTQQQQQHTEDNPERELRDNPGRAHRKLVHL